MMGEEEEAEEEENDMTMISRHQRRAASLLGFAGIMKMKAGLEESSGSTNSNASRPKMEVKISGNSHHAATRL